MKLVKVMLVLAIITTVVVGLAFAGAGGGGGGGGRAGGGAGGGMGGMGMGRGMGMGGMMGAMQPARVAPMMLQDQGLTEDQTSKLTALAEADANSFQKAQTALTTANAALTAAEMAGDEAKAKEAVKGVATATEGVSMLRLAEYKKIKGILTEAQYKQLQTSMTTVRGGMGMGVRRGGGGGGN